MLPFLHCLIERNRKNKTINEFCLVSVLFLFSFYLAQRNDGEETFSSRLKFWIESYFFFFPCGKRLFYVAAMPRDMTDPMRMVLHVAADGKLHFLNFTLYIIFICLIKLRL